MARSEMNKGRSYVFVHLWAISPVADQEPPPQLVLRFLICKRKDKFIIPLEYTSHEGSVFHRFCALHKVGPHLTTRIDGCIKLLPIELHPWFGCLSHPLLGWHQPHPKLLRFQYLGLEDVVEGHLLQAEDEKPTVRVAP